MMSNDKFVLWNAIPNIVLILFLLYYLSIRKGAGAVLAVIFVYLSLHGGYAVFAAATGDGINTMNALHYQASDFGAKLVGFSFLILCCVVLGIRSQYPMRVLRNNAYLVLNTAISLLFFLTAMLMGAERSAADSAAGYWAVVKETLFAVFMWGGFFLFSVVIKQSGDYWRSFRKEWILACGVLPAIMILLGVYEILTGMAWAGTINSVGYSARASGALFNPNVLGFWCAMMMALTSFMFHLKWISRTTTFVFMLLLAGALILCASRSGLLLAITSLLVISSLLIFSAKAVPMKRFDLLWPLGSFAVAFASLAAIIQSVGPSREGLANTLFANLHRFMQLPSDVFWIAVLKIYVPLAEKFPWVQQLHGYRASETSYISGHMAESIDGRALLGYTSDNSFMAIYAIGGGFALSVWLWLWLVLLWLGVTKGRKVPGVYSSYALSGLFFCFSSGLFLRSAQLFPVWIFLSMLLGACLCWWLTTDNGNVGNGMEAPGAGTLAHEPDRATAASGN